MNEQEATQRLRAMYQQSFARQERSIVPMLFGIRYADELAGYKVRNLERIAQQATGYANYATEIHQGRRMARYVQWREPEITDGCI